MFTKGLTLLAGCYIAGQLLGETLGQLIHVNANIGGVGFAMLLLILTQSWLEKGNRFSPDLASPILFWSRLYIPVIVAMSSVQNVRVAMSSGLIALVAGSVPVALCALFIPLLSKLVATPKTPAEWTT